MIFYEVKCSILETEHIEIIRGLFSTALPAPHRPCVERKTDLFKAEVCQKLIDDERGFGGVATEGQEGREKDAARKRGRK